MSGAVIGGAAVLALLVVGLAVTVLRRSRQRRFTAADPTDPAFATMAAPAGAATVSEDLLAEPAPAAPPSAAPPESAPPELGPVPDPEAGLMTYDPERQCPRCGRFAVSTGTREPIHHWKCGWCDFSWQLESGEAWPDVALRLWLPKLRV